MILAVSYRAELLEEELRHQEARVSQMLRNIFAQTHSNNVFCLQLGIKISMSHETTPLGTGRSGNW